MLMFLFVCIGSFKYPITKNLSNFRVYGEKMALWTLIKAATIL